LVNPLAAISLTISCRSCSQVHSVELLGGGVRMPRVKKTLEEYFKTAKLEVGQHLNGDEAMALGAAFRCVCCATCL